MNENEKKKDIAETLRRAERFQVTLIGEGIIVGGLAGFVVLLYRLLLENAGRWLNAILDLIAGKPLWIAGWFGILILLAFLVAKLVDWEPLISGSGIPQLEGEMVGRIRQTWWKVLAAKFAGGFLCILGGLALGREGPSIQLGAMAGKGVSRYLDRGRTEERYLLTCGASAGLAAAFHAPLAGVMFAMEEVHRNFSAAVLLCAMSSALTADFLCTAVLGTDSVFRFTLTEALPPEYYGFLVALGVVLGLLGVFYNWFTLKVQALYSKIPRAGTMGKLLIPFLAAGVLGLAAPELLGAGHSLVEELTTGGMAAGTMAFLLAGRFLFSAVSFGSGAPGGIFFPLLIIGAFIGGIFTWTGHVLFGLDMLYLNNFVLLAMAGYFTAIVRAPLTGIILIFEMTGTVSQLFSLGVVSICAYIVATLLHSEPIYESLLGNLLKRRGEHVPRGAGEKILQEFPVMQGSAAADHLVSEVEWPKNCLLVSVKRGERELLPRGTTRLLPGDSIVVLSGEYEGADVAGQMDRICGEQMQAHFFE